MSNFHYNYANMQTGKRNPSTQSHNAVPPPKSSSGGSSGPRDPASGYTKQGYSTMTAISQNALSASWGGNRKRAITEDEYFDDDDEDKTPALAYIPAPGSPSYVAPEDNKEAEESEEDDPLDAYMAGIEQQMKTETHKPSTSSIAVISEPSQITEKKQNVRNDLEEEDDEESYYRYMEENPNAGMPLVDEDNPDIEYDEDGNPIPPDRKRIIDPLPPVDHNEILYEPFQKDFYKEHEDITALTQEQVDDLRGTLGLTVTGRNPPKPVASFGHLNLDDKLLKAIIKAEFTTPSPIQSQAVPCALMGRDILGVAQTGSGKTAAFLWPLLMHVAAQSPVSPGDGPIALILAPTRELALQIYNEAKRFARVYDTTTSSNTATGGTTTMSQIRVICAYGGGSKWEQGQALKGGAEVVVATPGRIIDHVKGGVTGLERVTFLVLDEADRMFELGFEPQVRSVCNHVRPDRQTLLFSATFRRRILNLARDSLSDPVKITQGGADGGQTVNEDVTQHVVMLATPQAKRNWLFSQLVGLLSAGSVLVFVTRKVDAEQVAGDLRGKEYECLLLHGDMEQAERNRVIVAFRKGECPILVATDVAARGLDIPHIRTIVNFDVARDIDTHTHRIGRTGRAGLAGTAYTLITDKDKEFAGQLVRHLETAHQEVSEELLTLAMQSGWFRKNRKKQGKDGGGGANVGGTGLGFVEKGFTRGTSLNTTGTTSTTEVTPVAPPPARGPATDRLSAMKAAFKAQYSNQFTACSESPPTPPIKKKKSRWE